MTCLIPGSKVKIHICQTSGYIWGGYDSEKEAQRGMKLMLKKCPLDCTVTQWVKERGTVTLAFDDYPGVRLFSDISNVTFVPLEGDNCYG